MTIATPIRKIHNNIIIIYDPYTNQKLALISGLPFFVIYTEHIIL